MKTEVYTDPVAFLAAVNGKRKAKPATPRAAAGQGNRQAHLDTLAARGYTLVYSTPGGPCYLRNLQTGHETPHTTDYASALDAALEATGGKG